MQDLKYQIELCERKYHRPSGSVRLLAASKRQSIEKIKAIYDMGQRCFGESYLQEALPKIQSLPTDIEWHFIGPVQSNKTRKIAEYFSWVHSIDDAHIAKRLNDQRPPHLPPLNICIEVNISHEATKSGVSIDDVMPFAKYCLSLSRLRLRGLMTIPARGENLTEQRKPFHQLHDLYESLCQNNIPLDTLSMGMSEDFEAAIAEGSTMVRIGRALFGERN